jgi:hypothetical protein
MLKKIVAPTVNGLPGTTHFGQGSCHAVSVKHGEKHFKRKELKMALRLRDRNGVTWVDEEKLRQQMNIPETQELAISHGDGSVQRLQSGDYVDPDDDIIEMIPVIKQGRYGNRRRIMDDALILGDTYTAELDSELRWIMIDNFRTPPVYSPRSIPVLMRIPNDYPQSPPGLGHYNVYVRKGLRRSDGDSIEHYYEDVIHCERGCCELSVEGWYWWCFEEIKWDPRVNNFLSIAKALYICMDEL